MASRARLSSEPGGDPAQLDERLLGGAERRRAGGCARRRARCRRRSSASRTSGGSAASCRYGSTAQQRRRRRARRRAAATARSSPTSSSASAERLGLVLAAVGGRLGDRRRRQVAEAERCRRRGTTTRSRSMRRWAMPASCRRSRSAHRPVDGAVVGGRRRRSSRPQRDAVGADDDEGVALAGAARRHEVRHADAGPLGEQGDEALVLDELEPAQPGRRAGCPRYQARRQRLASSWASQASRP